MLKSNVKVLFSSLFKNMNIFLLWILYFVFKHIFIPNIAELKSFKELNIKCVCSFTRNFVFMQ